LRGPAVKRRVVRRCRTGHTWVLRGAGVNHASARRHMPARLVVSSVAPAPGEVPRPILVSVTYY